MLAYFRNIGIKLLLAMPMLCGMVSCNWHEHTIFAENRPLDGCWPKDTVLQFPFTIDDAHGLYQTQIIIRNTDAYPNQNIWFFIDEITPNGTCLSDTVQYFLADDFGRWNGSGLGSLFEFKGIYQQRVRFANEGQYTLRIRHGMRYDMLEGISDVGLRIIRIDNK